MKIAKTCCCTLAAVLCVAPAQAAQNCISNGDFETDVNGNVSASINWGYAKSGNRYTPANWTLNDRNHMGLVNEGTDRHNVLDTLGAHSLAIERYTGTSNLLEAKQSFSIPAPGTYRLTLLYMSWNFDTHYSHLRTFARLIQPGGVVTNQLNNFTPFSYGNGLESLGSFMSDTPTLAAYGSGNDYTLSFYATDTYSTTYSYCIIDNVNFSLRTLILGANETFSTPLGLEPHDMNLGADATLTYTPTTVTAEIIPSKVTFAAGAKIVIRLTSSSLRTRATTRFRSSRTARRFSSRSPAPSLPPRGRAVATPPFSSMRRTGPPCRTHPRSTSRSARRRTGADLGRSPSRLPRRST